MKKKLKFYRELEYGNKEKVKKAILESIEKRKREIEMFESCLITPIKNVIRIGEEVLKNRHPVEYYTTSSSTLSKFITEFIKGKK